MPRRPNVGGNDRRAALEGLRQAGPRFRLKTGLTQEDMMSYGFERRYYQRIESGTVNLSLKSLNKLAKAFGISFSELMQVD